MTFEVEEEGHHYLPLLVVLKALWYSSEDMSSRLNSAVKRCSSEVLGAAWYRIWPARLVKYSYPANEVVGVAKWRIIRQSGKVFVNEADAAE